MFQNDDINQLENGYLGQKKRITFRPPIRGEKGCTFLRYNQRQLRWLLIICNMTFAFEYELFNQFFKYNAESISKNNSNRAYIDTNVSLYSSLLQGVLISIPFGYLRDFLSQSFTYYFAAFIFIFQNIFKFIFLYKPNYHYYILNLFMYGISNGIYSDNATTLLMQFTYKSKHLFFTFVVNMICCMLIPKIIIFFIIQKASWSYGYQIVSPIFIFQFAILFNCIPRIIRIYRKGKNFEREEDPTYDKMWKISYNKAPLKKVISTFFSSGNKRVLMLFILLSIQLAFCQDQIYAGVKFFYSNDPSEYNGTYVPTSVDVKNDKKTFTQTSIIYIVSMLGLLVCLLTGIYMDKCKHKLKNLKYIVLTNGLILSSSFLLLNCINHTDIFQLDYPNINDIYNFPFFIVLFLQLLIGVGLGNCLLFAYFLVMYACPYKVKGTFLGMFTFTLSVIGCCQQVTVINLVDILATYQFVAGFILVFIAFLQFICIIWYPPKLYKQFIESSDTSNQTTNVSHSVTTTVTKTPFSAELSYSIN